MSGADAVSWVARVEGVAKEFRLDQERSNFRSLIPGRLGEIHGSAMFQALDQIDLTIGAGEALGIVGRNGAGKSTILRLLAGILEPTRGRVRVRGRVAPVIELGVGFDPELTGRENIDFAGDMLGLSRRQIDAHRDWIIDFSGIEDFLDMPVKRYSTGMQARLGFAVATAVPPDLLIVDEVLSVGDYEFQRRSLERIRTLHEEGVSLALVSHNLWMLDMLCDRLVLLERGRVVLEGDPRTVIGEYLGPEVVLSEEDPAEIAHEHAEYTIPDQLTGAVEFASIEITPKLISSGDPVRLRAEVIVHRPVDAVFAMSIFTSDRAVFAEREPGPSEFLRHPGRWIVDAELAYVPISTGRYQFRLVVLPEDDRHWGQLFQTAIAVATTDLRIDGDLTSRPGLKIPTTWSTALDEG